MPKFAVAVLVAVGAARLVAQVPTQPGSPTDPSGVNQLGQPNTNLPGTMLSPQNPFGGGAQGPDEFSSIWSAPSQPKWSGFPTFPARLSGYGAYPLPVDPDDPTGGGAVAPLPAAEPEPAGWPSWVRLRARKPLPFAVDVGLLVAQHGRTWFRESDEEPFVPTMMHDKFASLPVGAEVECRGRGAFEVLLHQSTRIEAKGRTRLKAVALGEDEVTLAIGALSWLRVHVNGRTNKLVLPDGSELLVQPVEVPEEMQAPLSGIAALFGAASIPEIAKPAMVEIERADEPSWYGGRATITNLGGREVLWRHAFGEVTLQPSQRVTLFLAPPSAPTAAALVPGDARVELDGERAVCRSVSATEVRWLGARVQVPAGAEVRIESLAGPVQRADVGPGGRE
ncbi:MAG: hypothetical protein KAI24_16950 [Planctomycetes bacterium]|nr:hypothetical protein [Planctomycetota bacterium]